MLMRKEVLSPQLLRKQVALRAEQTQQTRESLCCCVWYGPTITAAAEGRGNRDRLTKTDGGGAQRTQRMTDSQRSY